MLSRKRSPRRRTALQRRTRGRYSGRLSDRRSKGSHRSFRVDPSFFGLVIDSLAEYAVLTMDRDLTISSWSAAAESIFGYAEEEVIGTSVAPLFTPEDRHAGYPKREFDEALEKGRVSDERYHLAKGDRRFWTYGLAFPLKDEKGAVRGYVKIVRDETGRKREEDALVEKEERLRLAVDATGMGVWDYRPDTGTLHVSRECRLILGLPPEAPVDFPLFLSRFQSRDRAGVDGCVRSCLTKKASICELEARVARGDGESWVIIKAKALQPSAAAGGEIARVVGVIVDSTERKLMQLKAADQAEELERRVKERTASLLLANEQLESFAYSASHDLRAPLRKINLYSQTILESRGNVLDAGSREAFGRIRASVAEMNSLIDAVMSLSRVTTTGMTIADVDLSALAADIARDLRASEPQRSVTFDVAPGLVAKGDRELLAVALRNLLDNAWKFTRRRPQARVEFGVIRHADGEVYFLRDNGAGFDMRHSDKLFRPFERLHSAADFPGTGVGLGIVERVIRRHRGRLWAEAKPDQGATFFFTLFTEAF